MNGIALAISAAIVFCVSLGFLLGRKSLMKKMRKMERAAANWNRFRLAIRYGIRIRARIVEVKCINGGPSGTTKIMITASRWVAGMSEPYDFRETFVIDNNSQALYHIPIEGDVVNILYYDDGNSLFYFMERPWN